MPPRSAANLGDDISISQFTDVASGNAMGSIRPKRNPKRTLDTLHAVSAAVQGPPPRKKVNISTDDLDESQRQHFEMGRSVVEQSLRKPVRRRKAQPASNTLQTSAGIPPPAVDDDASLYPPPLPPVSRLPNIGPNVMSPSMPHFPSLDRTPYATSPAPTSYLPSASSTRELASFPSPSTLLPFLQRDTESFNQSNMLETRNDTQFSWGNGRAPEHDDFASNHLAVVSSLVPSPQAASHAFPSSTPLPPLGQTSIGLTSAERSLVNNWRPDTEVLTDFDNTGNHLHASTDSTTFSAHRDVLQGYQTRYRHRTGPVDPQTLALVREQQLTTTLFNPTVDSIPHDTPNLNANDADSINDEAAAAADDDDDDGGGGSDGEGDEETGEEIIRRHKKVTQPRQRQANTRHPYISAVVRTAKILYDDFLSREDPFPDDQASKALARRCLNEVISIVPTSDYTDPPTIHTVLENIKEVATHGKQFRSSLKKAARTIMPTYYKMINDPGIPVKMRCGKNKRRARSLLEHDRFIYAEGTDAAPRYWEHKGIIYLLRLHWYSPGRLALNPIVSHHYCETPYMTFALVAAAVECALQEYIAGKDVDFFGEVYRYRVKHYYDSYIRPIQTNDLLTSIFLRDVQRVIPRISSSDSDPEIPDNNDNTPLFNPAVYLS